MQHGARSLILVLSLVAAASACRESPTEFCERNPTDVTCDGTVVSETEIWKLELEQLEDGSTSRYPQRGTITMRLRLNRTVQPDPTCEGVYDNLVTTFRRCRGVLVPAPGPGHGFRRRELELPWLRGNGPPE